MIFPNISFFIWLKLLDWSFKLRLKLRFRPRLMLRRRLKLRLRLSITHFTHATLDRIPKTQ
jgi:hypothetical protein